MGRYALLGVDQWIATERAWDSVSPSLTSEQVLELRYEQLVSNSVGQLRRVCRFLGVDYDTAMTDYHRNSTYGSPDSSLADQWCGRSSSAEIALVESKAGQIMAKRGYEPATDGKSPGAIERVGLFLVDRSRIWRFGMKHYGGFMFIGAKLTR